MSNENYIVVWDLETQTTIKSMIGETVAEQTAACQVSVVCALRIPLSLVLAPSSVEAAMEEAAAISCWRDEDPDGAGPFDALFRLFDGATVIAGFNTCGFDHVVMRKYYGKQRSRYESHLLKSFDPFSRLRDVTGNWYKLDTLLGCNGLDVKTASGLEAIRMWERGERETLEEYCAHDVAQTARLLLQRELKIPNSDTRIPNHVFGIESAVRAIMFGNSA